MLVTLLLPYALAANLDLKPRPEGKEIDLMKVQAPAQQKKVDWKNTECEPQLANQNSKEQSRVRPSGNPKDDCTKVEATTKLGQ